MTDGIELMIGRIEGRMDGIGREIGDIKKILQCKTEDCSSCREEIDSQIESVRTKVSTIVSQHTGEQKIQSWKDAVFNKTTAIILVIIAVINFGLRFLPWGHG